jgi:hypothetical protein
MESWMSNLDKQQSDLMAELRAYREQHTSLAELVGSTGILQETLFRQKQELLQKFKVSLYINQILKLLFLDTDLNVNFKIITYISEQDMCIFCEAVISCYETVKYHPPTCLYMVAHFFFILVVAPPIRSV